jgi:hypothetical protein
VLRKLFHCKNEIEEPGVGGTHAFNPSTLIPEAGWPRTQKFSCLLSAGFKGVHHHSWLIPKIVMFPKANKTYVCKNVPEFPESISFQMVKQFLNAALVCLLLLITCSFPDENWCHFLLS